MLVPPDDLDLHNACNTDEIYALAYRLAAWALREGMDPGDVVDWVLDQPRELRLPRGSRGRLNPTRHHVKQGAARAVEQFIPGLSNGFDPDPLHELAARISGSGVTHERYLLGVIALCLKYETLTPVVTGPNLSEVVGVSKSSATDVLRMWGSTLAYGFFSGVSYDGAAGHGRVWTVNPDWTPASKPVHSKGCPRGKRCSCGVANTLTYHSQLRKIGKAKCDSFEAWLQGLKPGSGVTVTDACKATGLTRYAALTRLRAAEGSLLQVGTFAGGRVRKRGPGGKWTWVNQGETWFTKPL